MAAPVPASSTLRPLSAPQQHPEVPLARAVAARPARWTWTRPAPADAPGCGFRATLPPLPAASHSMDQVAGEVDRRPRGITPGRRTCRAPCPPSRSTRLASSRYRKTAAALGTCCRVM